MEILLQGYGFCLADNPADKVSAKISTMGEHSVIVVEVLFGLEEVAFQQSQVPCGKGEFYTENENDNDSSRNWIRRPGSLIAIHDK